MKKLITKRWELSIWSYLGSDDSFAFDVDWSSPSGCAFRFSDSSRSLRLRASSSNWPTDASSDMMNDVNTSTTKLFDKLNLSSFKSSWNVWWWGKTIQISVSCCVLIVKTGMKHKAKQRLTSGGACSTFVRSAHKVFTQTSEFQSDFIKHRRNLTSLYIYCTTTTTTVSKGERGRQFILQLFDMICAPHQLPLPPTSDTHTEVSTIIFCLSLI